MARVPPCTQCAANAHMLIIHIVRSVKRLDKNLLVKVAAESSINCLTTVAFIPYRSRYERSFSWTKAGYDESAVRQAAALQASEAAIRGEELPAGFCSRVQTLQEQGQQEVVPAAWRNGL